MQRPTLHILDKEAMHGKCAFQALVPRQLNLLLAVFNHELFPVFAAVVVDGLVGVSVDGGDDKILHPVLGQSAVPFPAIGPALRIEDRSQIQVFKERR